MTQVTTTNLEQAIDTALLEMPIPGAVPSDADVSTYQKLHGAKLAEIARRAQGLPAVTDKATEEQNQKALTALVKVRTDIDKWRKAMFEPLKRLKERVDGYLGTGADSGLQEQVSAIERPIRERLAAYKNAEELKRQEAIRIIDERNKAREALVISKGMSWNGQYYMLPDLILWPTDLRNLDEASWARFLAEQVDPRLAKMKEEADRKVREEAEAKERAKAEAERQKAEAERLANEREAMQKEKQAFRHEQLLALGAHQHPNKGHYLIPNPLDPMIDLFQCVSDLAGLSDEDWSYAKEGAARQEALRQTYIADLAAKEEEAASTAMAMSSGLSDSPDEVLVQETEEFLADKERVQALSDAINAVDRPLRDRIAEYENVRKATAASIDAINATREETNQKVNRRILEEFEALADEAAAKEAMERRHSQPLQEGGADLSSAIADHPTREQLHALLTPEDEAASDYDLQELHACALALLDEANKACAALGPLGGAKLVIICAHAFDCVRETRELMKP
jgi:hypothetical protein